MVPGDIHSTYLSQADGDYTGASGTGIKVELRAANHKGLEDPPFVVEFAF